MKRNKTRLLRWPQRLVQFTAWTLLTTYLVGVADPVFANVRKAEQIADSRQQLAPNATERLAERMIALEELLDRMQRRVEGRFEYEWQEIVAPSGRSVPPTAATRVELAAYETELGSLREAINELLPASRQELQTAADELTQRNLPAEIHARQAQDMASFDAGAARIVSELSQIGAASGEDAFRASVKSARTWLREHSSQRARPRFDPNKLAFGSRGESVRAPVTDRAALRSVFAGTMQAVTGLQDFTTEVSTDPTPADLAPTEDVQLTPAIRAKAQELGASPLALYRYVYDTVQFVPSYGSIQGSDYTLQTLRGNAFDQASLLIALLRASNIPARYVYGTVEVPIEKAMNWVGGVTAPRAALSLLGQGGIPSTGISYGGELKSVQLEHVWVEVWANQFPGGGMRPGAGDNWVALDPSFKQYDYTNGIDPLQHVNFDADSFVEHLNQASASNLAEGWVQGVDHAYINQRLEEYGGRLRGYVENVGPNATFAEVMGSRRIRESSTRGLPTGLPYLRIVQDAPVAVIPDHLRWKFRYSLGQPSFFGDIDGEVTMIERSLPSLAGKLLALSFKPASSADEAVLRTYVPADADGPEDLPTRFPANIVRLTAEFSVDGHAVGSGPTYGFGTELMTRKGLYVPGKNWEETDNPFSAGDYQAVGIDMHGMSAQLGARLKQTLETSKSRLDAHQYEALTKHDLTGAIMQSGVLSYFAKTWANTMATATGLDVVAYRLPSYGTVSTDSNVAMIFGTPRLFAPKGVLMDMDRIAGSSASADGDASRRKRFEETNGRTMSVYEHEVLEKLFSRPTQSVQGISAMKAIALANQQGQRIYTINEPNLSVALEAIDLEPVIELNIAEAVLSGKTVTVHQSPLAYGGQSNVVGFVVADPETGGAGYLLSSSADGGSLGLSVIVGIVAAHILAVLGALFVAGVVGLMLAVALTFVIVGFALAMIALAYESEWWCGFGVNLAFAGVGFVLPPGLLVAIYAAIVGSAANTSGGMVCGGG